MVNPFAFGGSTVNSTFNSQTPSKLFVPHNPLAIAIEPASAPGARICVFFPDESVLVSVNRTPFGFGLVGFGLDAQGTRA